MKKFWKGAVCVLLILLCALGFAAKYDTCGVMIGKIEGKSNYAGHISKVTGYDLLDNKIVASRAGFCVYSNQFGRAVILEVAMPRGNKVSSWIWENYGKVVLNIRTVATGIPTHFDFLGVANGGITVYELISRAGIPNGGAPVGITDFRYRTLDGYYYEVSIDKNTTLVNRLNIYGPDGMTLIEKEPFQLKILGFYLVLAAVLSGILVVLLTVPNAIRKRKAKKLLKQEG